VVVNSRLGEQRGIDRVIRMVMTEHHVCHVAGLRAVRAQRGEQSLPGGHHAGIDDDDRVAVDDQRDRPGHSLVIAVPADVPLVQHVYGCGSARRDREISHGADPTGARAHGDATSEASDEGGNPRVWGLGAWEDPGDGGEGIVLTCASAVTTFP
jgi:hypothetical protein